MVIINKNIYPHIYEWHKLGEDKTPEGRQYMSENQADVDREIGTMMDLIRDRYKIRMNHTIHESSFVVVGGAE